MEELSWESRRGGDYGEMWDGGRAFREGSNLRQMDRRMKGQRETKGRSDRFMFSEEAEG